MSNELPPFAQIGDKDEKFEGGSFGGRDFTTNQVTNVTINSALDSQVAVSNYKRQGDDNNETSSSNKHIKVAHAHGNDNSIPGWGCNRRVLAATESAALVGPLPTNAMMQKFYMNDSLVANSMSSNLNCFPVGNDVSLQQGDLLAIREQMHRNDVVHSMALARLLSANMQHGANNTNISYVDANQDRSQSHGQMQQHLLAPMSTSLNQINQVMYGGNNGIQRQSPFNPSGLGNFDQRNLTQEQVTQLLHHIQTTNEVQQSNINQNNRANINVPVNAPVNAPYIDFSRIQPNQASSSTTQIAYSNELSNFELPLCIEGKLKPHNERPFFPLGISEDPNWLSEFHCFVRSDLVEVFRASNDDVSARNNSIIYQQVGFRCRFCAHLPQSSRSGRSSAFPSSLRQMYQSLTMMLRDHFATCEAIPSAKLLEFHNLKDKPAQGATDSKRYWLYAAQKLGMTDTKDGIMITHKSRIEGINLPSFGTVQGQPWEDDAFKADSLVRATDRDTVSEFLFILLSQVQPIRLTETECIGNRRSLQVGLPGFGCRYCCNQKRLGLCRMFPARRRTLPHKVNDLYDHLRRCSLCPRSIKDSLEHAKSQTTTSFRADQSPDKEFFDRVWSRLGHSGVSAST